jgi:tyrosinase
MAIRKDANTLSSAERAEFVNAVKILKSTGIYDQFVLRHANAIMNAIHRSPAFLPWHRRFIWDFEKELQRVSQNPDLGLPYWNWPSGGENASMWEDDFLGGDGDPETQVVDSGPFRSGEWTIVNASGVQVGPLRRAFGRESWAQSLPTQQEIDAVMGVAPYDVPPWNTGSDPSFRNQNEGWVGPNLHNRGHGWVGGSMLPMTSPNDPVFFMHHCMVDKLWYEWQLRFPNQGYLPVNGGPFGQNLNDPMDSTPSAPIGPRPIDVLDSAVLGIAYDQLMPGTPQPGPTEPHPPDEGIPITTDGTMTEGNISVPGEVDLYRFEVSVFDAYTIETHGPSDTFITLYGPNDSATQLAANDDGGDGLNSRIAMNLSPGTYYVRVRLFSPNATGSYGIDVQASGGVDVPQLSVDGQPFAAAISTRNESDLYRFEIVNPGTYTVETEGATDVFLTLFGPDNQSVELANDDDSGIGFNSRIRMELAPGEYFAAVRHYSAFGTGPYNISVSSG